MQSEARGRDDFTNIHRCFFTIIAVKQHEDTQVLIRHICNGARLEALLGKAGRKGKARRDAMAYRACNCKAFLSEV